jgi:hypothetical protein
VNADVRFADVRGRFKSFKGTVEVDESNPNGSTAASPIATRTFARPTCSTSSITRTSPSAANASRERSAEAAIASA